MCLGLTIVLQTVPHPKQVKGVLVQSWDRASRKRQSSRHLHCSAAAQKDPQDRVSSAPASQASFAHLSR